jgi:DNA-binding transcriptional LysR family regulator
MDFDLRLLRHARALAEEGSFARAARALHLTQPALSRSIQVLERRVGVALFERNRTGVELTEPGRSFLAQAVDLLSQAEALERQVVLMRGLGGGRIVLGSGIFPTALFMGQALTRYLQAHPRVQLRVMNDHSFDLLKVLARREIDLLVGARPSDEEAIGLVVTPLSPRTACFLVRAGHPLLQNAAPSLADVAAYPVASASRMPLPFVKAMLAFRPEGESRQFPDFASESVELMKAVTLGTDHVLITALSSARHELESGALVCLSTPVPGAVNEFAISRLGHRTHSVALDALVEVIVDCDRIEAQQELALARRLNARAAD